LTPHCQDEFDDVGVALASNGWFFDIQYKRASWFKNALNFVGDRQEPINVFLW